MYDTLQQTPTGISTLTQAALQDAALAAAQGQGAGQAAAPAEAAPVGMKAGGVASLADNAESVREAGRYGDDRLVHMNTEELGIMQNMFGKPTINPKTGLPEFFLGKIFKSIGKLFKKIIRPIAKIASFVVPFIPGIGLPLKVGISALGGALSGDSGFDLKRGLLSGLLSFGAGKLASGLQGAAKAGGAGLNAAKSAIDVADDVVTGATTAAGQGLRLTGAQISNAGLGGLGATASGVTRANLALPAGGISGGVGSAASSGLRVGADLGTAAVTPSNLPESLAAAATPAAQTAATVTPEAFAFRVPAGSAIGSAVPSVLENAQQTLAGARRVLSGDQLALDALGQSFGQRELGALALGGSGVLAANEQEKFEEEQRALQEEEERKQREYVQFFRQNTVPFEFSAAQGGEVDDEPGYDMARGGKVLPPRYLDGPGDGMSDSIKANIDGKRPARLADGEFVIPADVVSHLGNGSSKAGAKKLYAMMDRVRKARTGTARQGREINSARLMPA
jgi:hypothetical protein